MTDYSWIIVGIAALWLIRIDKIIEFLRTSGRCILFARQNIQTDKIEAIKMLRFGVFASSVAIVTIILWREPCKWWAIVAGAQFLRLILSVVVRPKHDREIFSTAFHVYYNIFPLWALALLPVSFLFGYFLWPASVLMWIVAGWMTTFYYRTIVIEWQLLRGDFSGWAVAGYVALVELIPVIFGAACYFSL